MTQELTEVFCHPAFRIAAILRTRNLNMYRFFMGHPPVLFFNTEGRIYFKDLFGTVNLRRG